ncbi:MAG TPA: acyl-CoA dehydrogenase family protein, partial [Burkholderiales bacterium]|nr:acyl-CoA dehydrogenase family protein [Burkholderiales bacterium]
MDFRISDEQREMVDTVRKLRHKQLAPNAVKYLNGDFPWENMKALGEIGVLGMAVPQEYGGMDASVLDTVLVLEEISKACYATALAVLGEIGVQPRIIANYAPEELRRKYLPRVADGSGVLAICLTEPDAGTDVPNYKT